MPHHSAPCGSAPTRSCQKTPLGHRSTPECKTGEQTSPALAGG
jgi:hypothetical protein